MGRIENSTLRWGGRAELFVTWYWRMLNVCKSRQSSPTLRKGTYVLASTTFLGHNRQCAHQMRAAHWIRSAMDPIDRASKCCVERRMLPRASNVTLKALQLAFGSCGGRSREGPGTRQFDEVPRSTGLDRLQPQDDGFGAAEDGGFKDLVQPQNGGFVQAPGCVAPQDDEFGAGPRIGGATRR